MSRTLWTWLLISIWVVLMAFAAVSQISPDWLESWAESGKTSEAGSYKRYGDSFLHRGEWGMAIAQYQKALDIDPSRVSVMVNLAAAYTEAGMTKAAARTLTQAERLATDDKGPVYYNCGELLRRQGKPARAAEYYQRAIGTMADQGLVHRQLGQIYLELENYPRAKEAFETALVHQQDTLAPLADMLRTSIEAFESDSLHLPILKQWYDRLQEGVSLATYDFEVIRQKVRSDPEVAKTHNHLGLVNIKLGDYSAAAEHFRQSAIIWPGNVDASRGLAALAQASQGTATKAAGQSR